MNTEFRFLTSVFSWTLEIFKYGKSELFDDKTKNGFKIQDLKDVIKISKPLIVSSAAALQILLTVLSLEARHVVL